MGDQHRGAAIVGDDLDQQRLHVGARHLVQRAEGFVEQQHLRLAGKAARQRRPLRHPARQRGGAQMAGVGQADLGDGAVHARLPFGARQLRLALEVEPEGHVALKVQPGQQCGVLEGDGKARVNAVERRAIDGDGARVGRLQPRQHPQQAGLADAAGAEDGNDLSRGKVQVEIGQHRLRRAGIAQRDAAGLQGGTGAHAAFFAAARTP